jgi:hypothetical protein
MLGNPGQLRERKALIDDMEQSLGAFKGVYKVIQLQCRQSLCIGDQEFLGMGWWLSFNVVFKQDNQFVRFGASLSHTLQLDPLLS